MKKQISKGENIIYESVTKVALENYNKSLTID